MKLKVEAFCVCPEIMLGYESALKVNSEKRKPFIYPPKLWQATEKEMLLEV